MKKWLLLLGLAVGINHMAQAEGDPEAGKTKAVTCAACHGNDGNSAIAMNPKIAGQHQNYLAKQLKDFRLASKTGGEEGRNNAVMNGMAGGLSDQDIEDLAAWFASNTMTNGDTPEEVIEAGSTLYSGGDLERGITACIACHGPRGNGMGLANFPDISGQHADYTKSQLEQFRNGTRKNDPNEMMQDIAKKLTDADIKILSQYIAGLH